MIQFSKKNIFNRLCPECLFYTLGNLEKSGKQFEKLSSKVRQLEFI